MSQLRPTVIKLYVAAVTGVALALSAHALLSARPVGAERGALAVVFAALVVVVNLFPLRFAYKYNLSLDTTVVFAAVLIFEPGVAMLVAGGGCLLAEVLRRMRRRLPRWHPQVAFNAAQTALQAGVGGFLLDGAEWRHDELLLNGVWQLVMVVVAAGAMYLVNTALVAVVVALQSGQSPLAVWRQSTELISSEQLSEFALGLLAAIVVDAHSLALPLLLFPALAVYHSLERHIQLRQQTIEAMEALADVVDIRDPYTANHSRRVAAYARGLAAELGLGPDEADLVELASRVHDVGKVTVDTSVLTKQGALTASEWEELKRHPVTGAEILGRFPQFADVTSYVLHHHERVDGRGYPDGLDGERIPLGARIIAVADSFDVMTSDRPYRTALMPGVVLSELKRGRGIQWDARVVDALLRLLGRGQVPLPSSGGADSPRSVAEEPR